MNIPQVSAVTPSEGVVHSRLFDTPSEGVIGSFLAKSGIHGLSRHFGDSTPSEGVIGSRTCKVMMPAGRKQL